MTSPLNTRPRILWVLLGSCLPLNSGGVIYSYHLLVHLMKHCHVQVLELHSQEPRTDDAVPYAHEVERVYSPLLPDWTPSLFFTYLWPIVRNLFTSREPFIQDLYASRELAERAQQLATSGRFDLVVADGLTVASAFVGWEKERGVPAILLQHNVEANIWKGMTRLQRNPFTRLFYHTMARRMHRREPELCRLFEGVTTISDPDAAYHRECYRLPHILGSVIPGTNLVTQVPPPAVLQQEASPCIAFVGKMNWLPNMDAVFWFAHEVLPLIRQIVPDARFRIIGRDPVEAMHRLAATTPGIEVTGTVEDVLPHLNSCAVQVIPLRAGSGVRHKILESMAAGVPVVSTTLGAEGLDLIDGQEILLADDAPALSAAILRLLQDATLRKTIAEKALARVARDFSWDHSTRRLLQLCSPLLPGSPEF